MDDLNKEFGNFATRRTENLNFDNNVDYQKAKEAKNKLYRNVERLLPDDYKQKLEDLENTIVSMYAMEVDAAYKLGFIDGITIKGE